MHHQIYEDIYRAEMTHWWFCARRRIVANLIRHFAPENRPLQIADIGCGMGSTVGMLSEFGRVLGMDYSPTALAYSRQRGLTGLAAAALPNLPCRDASFDVACALDVIEHIDDDESAVREIHRVCKPGGLIVITVPAYQWLWSEHDDINDHKRRYTRPQLRARLASLGVTTLRMSYMNTLLAPLALVFRLVKSFTRHKAKPPEELKSDVFSVPFWLNRLLYMLFACEAGLLKYVNLPFGISLVCVARKHET
jgi:SAM-dependent methyltransferase